MTISLRAKLIAALLISSVLVTILFGFLARWMLMRSYSDAVLQDAFSRFRVEVTAYLKTYDGSWEEATRHESFPEFAGRWRRTHGSPAAETESNRLSPVAGFRSDGGILGPGTPGTGYVPPQPGGEPTPVGPPEGPNPGFDGPGGPAPPQAGGPDAGGGGPPGGTPFKAPFRFLLYSLRGRVLMGDESYGVGEVVPASLRASALPIIVNHKTAVWAVPLANPNLNPVDKSYLASIDKSIRYAVCGALLLALALGVLFGTALSRDLRNLTAAMEAVTRGDLGLQVKVNSRDEISVLAAAFNRMSVRLQRTHAELRLSTEETQRQAALLKELSTRDSLTGLWNRRYLNEQATMLLAQARRYRQPMTFMIGDLDHFKKINDRFSHAVGDEVLRVVGRILQQNTRETDLVIRYGGEEFVVVFYGTALEGARQVCEKLRQTVEAHPWHEVHPDLQVTMSMGLCDDLQLGTWEDVVACADERLYDAKRAGRNQVCCAAPRVQA